ncbi:M23 family metallopeptidase [Methylorubrum thiocyanatum]|uniref:M23 family metallopeptidase n=1 Tax=Methylorubrum thiocyanatum TaxID=47958 RepID=UPI003F7F16D9
MAPGGQRITSPYGVDRTGRPGASRGYHQGVDIVNSQGAGTKIFSGSSGPVKYYGFNGGGVVADVRSDDTRFVYLHMATTILGSGESGSVAAGDQVGTMGCEGMRVCAPHLHLYTLLKGSSLSASGYNGRTWRERSGKGVPMTADQIKAAAPETWYYVNPEPFLPRQIPISNPYPDMEGGRRTTSLPKTCTPGTNQGVPSEIPSTADTQSREKAISSAAGIPTGAPDHAVKVAAQPRRSLYLELARMNATELSANTLDYESQMTAALAQLVALQALDGRTRGNRP